MIIIYMNVKIIVDDSPMINDYYKINKDLFVYSIEKKMIFKKFDGEDISDREIIIREPYITFLYYYVKDKILFAEGNLIIYLIKLNISNPEVFQKINLENNMHTIKYRYHFFDEDSIYIYVKENNLIYLNQYEMKDGELKNVSKIEINKIQISEEEE